MNQSWIGAIRLRVGVIRRSFCTVRGFGSIAFKIIWDFKSSTYFRIIRPSFIILFNSVLEGGVCWDLSKGFFWLRKLSLQYFLSFVLNHFHDNSTVNWFRAFTLCSSSLWRRNFNFAAKASKYGAGFCSSFTIVRRVQSEQLEEIVWFKETSLLRIFENAIGKKLLEDLSRRNQKIKASVDFCNRLMMAENLSWKMKLTRVSCLQYLRWISENYGRNSSIVSHVNTARLLIGSPVVNLLFNSSCGQ